MLLRVGTRIVFRDNRPGSNYEGTVIEIDQNNHEYPYRVGWDNFDTDWHRKCDITSLDSART